MGPAVVPACHPNAQALASEIAATSDRVARLMPFPAAAAGASNEPEFFARLEQAGLLVRRRFSPRNPTEITGCAVALPGDVTGAGAPVWFGGGKLAADLTLPKLRCR